MKRVTVLALVAAVLLSCLSWHAAAVGPVEPGPAGDHLERLSEGILCVLHEPAAAPAAREALDILKEALAEYSVRLPAGDAVISVYLCRSEQSFKARAGAYGQARVGGVAKSDKGVIIVRSPSILPSPELFRGTLRHELIHVLLARNTESAYVPRWFDEGIAMILSKELRWESSIEVARMYVQKRLAPYREIDFGFAPIGDEQTFSGAYAQALSMTRWLLHRTGEGPFWQLVGALRTMSFEDALRVYGKLTPAGLYDGWYASLWKVAVIASLVSGFSAFQLMAILVIVVYVHKRRRGQRLMQQWQEEEEADDGPEPFRWESVEEGPYPWEEDDDDDR